MYNLESQGFSAMSETQGNSVPRTFCEEGGKESPGTQALNVFSYALFKFKFNCSAENLKRHNLKNIHPNLVIQILLGSVQVNL